MDVETILSTRADERQARKWIISEHARARSEQRFISFSEIQSAVDNAERMPADRGAWEYRFAGIVAVVDPTETIVLTVYPEPGFGIDLDKVKITPAMLITHKQNRRILRDKTQWTSHTVAVIDQSGSMRVTDIDKGVSRSDLTWLALAVEVVYKGLVSGERKAKDVMSVVFMRDEATTIIDRWPTDWVLYNRLIDIMNTGKPSTGGKYIPALDMAETLLTSNSSRNCALSLLFLSDGRPSDQWKGRSNQTFEVGYDLWLTRTKLYTSRRVEGLASAFGKRLNMCFFAIGPSESSDFSIMKHMADTAKAYECPVHYQKATLQANVLSTALRTMSSTTTDTMTTISDIPKNHVYRKFIKMKQTDVGSPVKTDTWEVFIQRIFVGGKRVITKSRWTKCDGWVNIRPEFSHPSAIGLAWETRWFGEGKERLAKELREVGPDGRAFVGPPLVLKASITVSEQEEVDSKEFHKRFCKTQLKAQKFAKVFNNVTLSFPVTIPRIEFIPCWIYMIRTSPEERKGFLVEPALDVLRYKKFNDNAGNVFESFALPRVLKQQKAPLCALIEEDEEEEEEDSSNEGDEADALDDSIEGQEDSALPESFLVEELEGCDVLQSFSCFTYKVVSGRRYLVCDLQGTYDEVAGLYRLTDPVIHTSEKARDEIRSKFGDRFEPTTGAKEEEQRHTRFGRTDRGQVGINDFFESHKCSKLCRMLGGRRFRNPVQHCDSERIPLRRNPSS